ncbi:oxalate decarboxylase family bicupin [Colletotrichum navitas]|uniref:Oxalate decarboxylase family bicupin n=1 Tax=Colletotrichum navitas TaxID=681940 RepID=A0AAD8UZ68_9PEZI|nr:oxalate decarboxylase family bicupin [Colletotrichum navitas]KAK1574601.1 oxalate decarboxylase family bicupin [Colletotrichum navitas]
MQLTRPTTVAKLLLLWASVGELCSAAPHYDSPRERLRRGMDIPAGYRKKTTGNPYTPGFRDPNDGAVDSVGDGLDPLPFRNGLGASVLGPWNAERSRQNPDLVRPPSTDKGNMPNMRWSFADSHIRIEEGGWTRQTTVRELSTSVELAGVNMRLGEGVIRELHWHKEAEWAYVLDGEVRVTALDYEGGNFIDDLKKGDLWYFPSGVPHSLQGLSPNGTEFLLIFDDGRFSEESTFILSDWLGRAICLLSACHPTVLHPPADWNPRLTRPLQAHTPMSVIAENFHLEPEVFKHLPESEKYIFQGTLPGPIDEERPKGKHAKKSRFNFTHRMLEQEPERTSGGEVRITDSRNFPVSKTVAAAHLTIQPGALREMHWHPNADEWSFFIAGRARVTVFAAEGTARTFDYVPGDVGIVPRNMGHFVENIGDEPVEMLEVFRADAFRDFSLFQWMGETPKKLVVDHLFKDDRANGERFWDEVKEAQKDPVTKFQRTKAGSDDAQRVEEL